MAKEDHVFDSVMVQTLMTPLIACQQLFMVYVVLHGHYSPGGGFQAGGLLAASLILPMLLETPNRKYPHLGPRAALALAAAGVLIYALFAIVPLLMGRPMLDYAALPFGALEPAARRSLGILGIEIGVMFGVAGAILSIFHSLRGGPREAPPS